MSVEVRTNPYIGLRRFDEKDSTYFFGRDEQIAGLGEKLEASRFVAIVGSSGCGKSSLVEAGLIPALKGNLPALAGKRFRSPHDVWRVVSLRPGFSPIGSLAASLAPPEQAQALYDQLAGGDVNALVAHLKKAGFLRQGEGLLLLVDQFEEIFRFRERTGDAQRRDASREESANFVSLLLDLSTCADEEGRPLPIYVTVTMRSDFIGACDAFLGLPEALNQSQFLVPRLTRKQLRQAITGPPRLWGIELDGGLVNRILNDSTVLRITDHAVGESTESADELPLLEHVLMRTWDTWWNEIENSSAAADCPSRITEATETTIAATTPAHVPTATVPNVAPDGALSGAQKTEAGATVTNTSTVVPSPEHTAIARVRAAAKLHPLAVEHYERAGTIHTALTLHAREALAEAERALPGRGKMIVRRIFQTLTDTDIAGLRTRRPALVSALVSAIDDVKRDEVVAALKPFVLADRSFLVVSGLLEKGDPSVDICHESLIRRWEDLDAWSREEAESVNLYRDLVKSAEDYARQKKGLWTNPQLQLARRWRARNRPTESWGSRRAAGFAEAMDFLNRSLFWHYARIGSWVAVGLTIIVVVGASAWAAGKAADANRLAAESNRISDSDPLAGVRLALGAVEADPLPIAISALQNSMSVAGGRSFPALDSAISPDGKWLITRTTQSFEDVRTASRSAAYSQGPAARYLRLARWDLATIAAHQPLTGDATAFNVNPLTPDVLPEAAHLESQPRRSERMQGAPIPPQIVLGTKRAALFGGPTTEISTVDLDGWTTQQVFDEKTLSLTQGEQPQLVRLSPSDEWMVVGTDRGRVLQCAMADASCQVVAPQGDHIVSLEISDRWFVVLRGASTTATLSSLSDPSKSCEFNQVTAVALGSEPDVLLMGSLDGSVTAANPCSAQNVMVSATQHIPVTSLALVGNGPTRRVAAGDAIGRIVLSRPGKPDAPVPLKEAGEGSAVILHASPDGQWLAGTLRESNSVLLWSLATAISNSSSDDPVKPMALHGDGTARGMDFSRDGHWLLTTDEWDSHLWDLRSPDPGSRTALHRSHSGGSSLAQAVGKSNQSLWTVSSTKSGPEICPISPDLQMHIDVPGTSNHGTATTGLPSDGRSPLIISADGSRLVSFVPGQSNIDAWSVLLSKTEGQAGTQPTTSTQLSEMPLPQIKAGITAAAFDQDGTTLAVATDDGVVHLWSYLNGQFTEVRSPVPPSNARYSAVAVYQSRDRVLAMVENSGQISVVRVPASGTGLAMSTHGAENLGAHPSLLFSADGEWLLVRSSVAPVAQLIDTNNLSSGRPEMLRSNARGAFTTARFVPSPEDGSKTRWIIIGTAEGLVDMYDVNDLDHPRRSAGHNTGSVNTIEVSPDGKKFVSGGDDGRAFVGSVDDPESDGLTLQAAERNDAIVAARFVSNDAVITLSRSGIARQWAINPGLLLYLARITAGQSLRDDERTRYMPQQSDWSRMAKAWIREMWRSNTSMR